MPAQPLLRTQGGRYASCSSKYRAPEVTVIEVGVEFSRNLRQIVGWEVAAG
ncbi:hypothetical protein TDMWS_19230 [Thermodesulfomicrobium sp. WS]|jgi:hypothetical protein|uniref:hypothetical protein n=1 Tax=Thermodesulfomicrobium sp. WS TaxID=3004129 RepID=UPI0024929BFA|nr:hypothetical protein [Thermodesulfomicrobium sp. WS]BDV01838.1 hypothetical protein TDMWS_19230 [Thermodesulfomicrobium sp. WS]